MRFSRRRFLSTSAALALPCTPHFWQRIAQAADPAEGTGGETVLVVIQLSGGNDGLNTVVPFRDPAYAAARPTLKLPADKLLKINGDLAFHPSMTGFAKLLEKSQLAVVQGVGYPKPNRSHFTSMDFWHRGKLSETEPFGWIGRGTEHLPAGSTAVHVANGDSPLALRGPSSRNITVRSLQEFQLRVALKGDDPARRKVMSRFAETSAATPAGNSPLLDRIKLTAQETYRSADKLREVSPDYKTSVSYPDTPLGKQLKLIAQLIAAGVRERLYYAEIGGFDTHADQLDQHASLLTQVSAAMTAFQDDIVAHGQQSRVLTMAFSEFGRRVKENGSGTDHGAASSLFLMGDKVVAGPVGACPSLTDLDDGDLKFHTDFRSVYTTLLDDWLKLPAAEILGASFPKAALLKA